MKYDDVIRKIRACLALASSPVPAEAAAALRQAEKLMREHSVELAEVHAAGATQEAVESGFKSELPAYAVILSGMIGRAFQCDRLSRPLQQISSTAFIPPLFIFVGIAPRPELATYAYTVLLRQLQSARRKYVRGLDKRCKTQTRTARSEAFTVGWLNAVREEVERFAGRNADDDLAVLAYVRTRYPNAQETRVEIRAGGARTGDALHDGLRAGKSARIQHGLNGAAPVAALPGGRK